VGRRPPEEPLSALAPPLAARHIGRAVLPSATFPHTLPGDVQIPGPSGSAQHRGCNVTRSCAVGAISPTRPPVLPSRRSGHCQPGWSLTHAESQQTPLACAAV
jgi:hypothetical protein